MRIVLSAPGDGSSPRARGTRSDRSRARPRSRFIPACAGNTISRLSLQFPFPVHPRVRGEHIGGLSPRSRSSRFIPACAGNTLLLVAWASGVTVHPRVRGEHAQVTSQFARANGSSPRARGTHVFRRAPGSLHRFIPACAGNTLFPTLPRWAAAVHPRVRGEHRALARVAVGAAGSSPRARGTPTPAQSRRGCPRFIPACAGNTRTTRAGSGARPVHPRVRGEHAGMSDSLSPPVGSSPRARGTLANPCQRRCGGRFIPACAGNTLIFFLSPLPPPVHPRVRGEHPGRSGRRSDADGSSPRARGTRAERAERRLRLRFIPACAGNTTAAQDAETTPSVHPRVRGEH